MGAATGAPTGASRCPNVTDRDRATTQPRYMTDVGDEWRIKKRTR